jgi:pimeloyl-ACP methyl ester carboxylesterase
VTDRPQPSVAGVRHSFVDAGGLRMHVAEAGEGEPVVLVHGWPQHWYVWRHLIPALAESHRVIAPDLRGLGWTEAPPRGYAKDTLAEDLLNLLDAMGLERVCLAGHDWGGMAGFLLALKAPERVRRFVPLNTAHPWLTAGRKDVLQAYRLWYQYLLASPVLGRRVVRRLVAAIYRAGVDSDRVTREEWQQFVDQFDEPERAVATQQIYRTFLLQEARAITGGRYAAERLTVPTLCLHGENDPVVKPERFDNVPAHADDFRLEVLPGPGHFVLDEAPEEVLVRMLDFFS